MQKIFQCHDIIRVIPLTHWDRDKMAAIFQTTFSNAFFLNENVWISLKLSLKFVLKVRINNSPGLVQIMTWHWSGDKPLSEPMLVCCTDAYLHHSASMCRQIMQDFMSHFRYYYLCTKPYSKPAMLTVPECDVIWVIHTFPQSSHSDVSDNE